MPIVRVDNVGKYGVITDQVPWEMPPEAWSSASNIRFTGEGAERILGHAAAFDTHDGSGNDEDPIYLMHDTYGTTNYWYLLQAKTAAADAIIAYNGSSSFKDITRSGGMTATLNGRWNGGILGGVPIFNPGGDDYPVYWAHDFATPTLCANLTWNASTTWANAVLGGGTGIRARVMRPFKQHMFALYPSYPIASGSTVSYPHSVLWSHPADPGTIPASWDWTDVNVDAGKAEISDTKGYLVDLIPMRDLGVLYKTDSLFGVQYVGPPYIFRFYKISDHVGMLTQDCAVEFKGKQFVVGFNDVYVHDGQEIESIATRRIRDILFTEIDQDAFRRAFCIHNKKKEEIWFCYPEVGNGYCTKAAIWSWRHNAWTFRDLPDTTHIQTGVWAGSSGAGTWDGAAGTWEAESGFWDAQIYSATEEALMMTSVGSGKVYELDSGYAFGSATTTATLERVGIALVGRDREGQPRIDPSSRKILRKVWPRLEGDVGTEVSVYVGSQQHVGDAVDWSGPYTYAVGTTDRLDVLKQGRLFSIRFETTSNKRWILHGYGMDIELTSRY